MPSTRSNRLYNITYSLPTGGTSEAYGLVSRNGGYLTVTHPKGSIATAPVADVLEVRAA